MAVDTAREEKAMRSMTERLVGDFSEVHTAEQVEAVVGEVRSRFDGHTVREFVPILVERIARRELNPPAPEAESEAENSIAPTISPDGNSNSNARHLPDIFRSAVATLPRNPKVLAGIAVGVVAVVAVAVTVSGRHPAVTAAAPALTDVHGVIGSEKADFFADPQVTRELAAHGLKVDVDPAGSRQMATTTDLSHYDFAFPSSADAAQRIQLARNIGAAKYTPFSSPMAIATFAPIVDLLTAAGVVTPGPTPQFDVKKYLELAEHGTQWNQLPGNTTYAVPKNILVSTTDPRTSNSAAMFLAVTAYVANDNSTVRGNTAEDYAVARISRLFTRQGFTESSSDAPFKDYLANGMGPAPMVWIYEAQYVDAAVHGALKPGMVLMYPKPTTMSQHTVVPLDDKGDTLGKLLTDDPVLQELAAEHGFRPMNQQLFTKVAADHQVPVDPDVLNSVNPPDYETLEHLLDGVAKAYS